MKIAIIGSGGVGGYHAGALMDAGAEVHIVTTPRHVAAISDRGLIVHTESSSRTYHPASVTTDGTGVGVCDLVMITVKLTHFEEPLENCQQMIGPDTLVLTFQNGVVAPDMVAKRFGAEHALPCVTFIVAFIDGPGEVRQIGARPKMLIGSAPIGLDGTYPILEEFKDALLANGVDAHMSPTIAHDLWYKYAVICTMGGVNVLANATVGEIRSFDETHALWTKSVKEVQSVARASGVDLTNEDCEKIVGELDSYPEASTSSTQRDLIAGKLSELEYLNGALVAKADAAGIDVPLQRLIVTIARLHAKRGRVGLAS